MNGYLVIVKYLLEAGADINARDILGDRAFTKAVKKSHLSILKYLVEHGAYT